MIKSSGGNPNRYPKNDELGRGGRFAPKGYNSAVKVRTKTREEYDAQTEERKRFEESKINNPQNEEEYVYERNGRYYHSVQNPSNGWREKIL